MKAVAHPSRGLAGRVRPPGDKSVSHRALILNALAEGEARITGLLEGEDVLATAAALRALGAEVARESDGVWRVRGAGAAGWKSPAEPLDMGNSGTAARLLMGAAAAHPIEARFVGDASLSRRPMGRVLTPLTHMGAGAESEEGRLPVRLTGARPLKPLRWESPVASAQVKSALLLAGLGAEGETVVVEPHVSRDHTERMLPAFGVRVETEPMADGSLAHRLTGPARLRACDVRVPADPSSAAFLAAAVLVTADSAAELVDVMANATRDGFVRAAQAMGAGLAVEAGASEGEALGAWRVASSALRGADPDPSDAASYIDEVPILAVLAAFAEGATRFHGVGELRVKESDRIAATSAMLRVNGVTVDEFEDGFTVHGAGAGGVPGGGVVEAYGDHRIAMSALVLGLGARASVSVTDVSAVATSYPSFFDDMTALGASMTAPDFSAASFDIGAS